MWRATMILGTFLFGLGAVSGLTLAGFSAFEGDLRTAGLTGVLAAGLGWGAFACRRDWQRENQRREFERAAE